MRFRKKGWVLNSSIWRAVLSLFYPPVIIRGKNGKNSENPVGSNKSEKRKPKSAVYRSFWASVVYFHLRLISTKSHKREMTRNQVDGNVSWVRIPPLPPAASCRSQVTHLTLWGVFSFAPAPERGSILSTLPTRLSLDAVCIWTLFLFSVGSPAPTTSIYSITVRVWTAPECHLRSRLFLYSFVLCSHFYWAFFQHIPSSRWTGYAWDGFSVRLAAYSRRKSFIEVF